jgi:molybdopterin adenylyltransferase
MAFDQQIKAAVITVSDSRKEDSDVSGVTLVGLLLGIGAEVAEKVIVTDDEAAIAEVLSSRARTCNLIFTTGGTGFATRDVTPEATLKVIERPAPGIADAMRATSLNTTPTAMLSRGVSGIVGSCLIVNLPGSPGAVVECFNIIKPVLQHAVNLLMGETEH